MKRFDIARVCHEANRALCLAAGDATQHAWYEAPDWQRNSAHQGVNFCEQNPEAPPSANHEAWSRAKLAEGWVFGAVKDEVAKTHPCLVPFDQLPPHQQAKDALFKAICGALLPFAESLPEATPA